MFSHCMIRKIKRVIPKQQPLIDMLLQNFFKMSLKDDRKNKKVNRPKDLTYAQCENIGELSLGSAWEGHL